MDGRFRGKSRIDNEKRALRQVSGGDITAAMLATADFPVPDQRSVSALAIMRALTSSKTESHLREASGELCHNPERPWELRNELALDGSLDSIVL